MSIFSLFSIPALLEDVITVVGKHVSDPAVMGEIKAQLAAITVSESLAQAKLETAEQTSPRDFLNLVRATCEWICIYGIFIGIVVNPILTMFNLPCPQLPMTIILNLLYALLGLGATRIATSLVGGKL